VGFLSEIFEFAKERKKLWLFWVLLAAGVVGLLTVFTSSPAVAPFIYTLF
jgi:TctA family transporter